MPLIAAALGACLVLAAGAEKPRLVVLDVTAPAAEDRELAAALTDALAAEVSARGFFQALSSGDARTLLGIERQRQLMGCSEEGGCLTELAGALGTRMVMSGGLTRVGDLYQLSLQTLDTQKAVPVGRSVRLARDGATLRAQIPYAVAEATATPSPPTPTHLLPYSLIGAGGLLLIGGGVVGLYSLSQESLLQSELNQGTQNPAQLRTMSYYTQARAQYGTERSVALVGLVAGAALIGAGLYVHPDLHAGARVAFVPGPGGAAIAGTW